MSYLMCAEEISEQDLASAVELADSYNSPVSAVVGGDVIVMFSLIYHTAVLINPHIHGGCEQRYCFKSAEVALIAINIYIETRQWLYWHKDHTANLYVSEDGRLFRCGPHAGDCMGTVDWTPADIADLESAALA